MGRIQKKEGLMRIPPNRYGQRSAFSNFGAVLEFNLPQQNLNVGAQTWEPESDESGRKRHFAMQLFNVAMQFFFVAVRLLVEMTSALQKANVAVRRLQRNFPKIAAQLLFRFSRTLKST